MWRRGGRWSLTALLTHILPKVLFLLIGPWDWNYYYCGKRNNMEQSFKALIICLPPCFLSFLESKAGIVLRVSMIYNTLKSWCYINKIKPFFSCPHDASAHTRNMSNERELSPAKQCLIAHIVNILCAIFITVDGTAQGRQYANIILSWRIQKRRPIDSNVKICNSNYERSLSETIG